MKKRNKWKIWLSNAILKHRRTYAGIPGFFKKRIVNTLCLSFLLLYGGCALGLAQRSAGFVGWTVFLTICGIGDAVYVYYLAVTRSYEVVEGTVSEIHWKIDQYFSLQTKRRDPESVSSKIFYFESNIAIAERCGFTERIALMFLHSLLVWLQVTICIQTILQDFFQEVMR